MSSGVPTVAVGESYQPVTDVPVLVIQVESPNVLYVRKSPLSADEREFLRAAEDYCGRIHASCSSRWRASLSQRQLSVGEKYFALDGRQGGTQWRRGLLTNVVTVRGGHRACVYLIDEARSIDVPLNHLLPMPDSFGLHPPLLRKVIVSGIRPCSLVSDDLTMETKYGPTSTWDAAANQYAMKLFLLNSSLSDARLHHIHINSETRLCFADLSFRVDDRTIPSYAEHLKKLRFAADDDAQNSFAIQASALSDKIGRNEKTMAALSPSSCSDTPLTLVDDTGAIMKCYKPVSVPRDENNNDSFLRANQTVPALELASTVPRLSRLPAPPTLISSEGANGGMQITFQPASPENRSVQV